MRQYFFELLCNLDKLAGLKQMEKLQALPNAKDEINTLLKILCTVSSQFPYIPEKDQQRIISEAVISDQEFIGLNAKIIYKWLFQQKDKYFKELAHQQAEVEHEPLTGEAREAKLKEWLSLVNQAELNFTSHVVEKKNRLDTIAPKGETDYRSTPAERLIEHELHIQWIKENHDPRTGHKLETWISEEDWLKKRETK